MKKILTKMNSFMIFDFPLQIETISARFATTNSHYQKHFPYWSFAASRKKVIADYWFRHVLQHFAFVMVIALASSIFLGTDARYLLFSLFFSTAISFLVTVAFSYWPAYYSDFLPKLDTVIAEQEKIINVADELKKCKRTQFPIPALTVIFYVFSKACDIPLPACNDHSAELLNNLFGADKDKLKQNLSRLYKPSGLSPKERAEMQKGINSASAFFEGLNYPPSQKILDQLELKLQRP